MSLLRILTALLLAALFTARPAAADERIISLVPQSTLPGISTLSYQCTSEQAHDTSVHEEKIEHWPHDVTLEQHHYRFVIDGSLRFSTGDTERRS